MLRARAVSIKQCSYIFIGVVVKVCVFVKMLHKGHLVISSISIITVDSILMIDREIGNLGRRN